MSLVLRNHYFSIDDFVEHVVEERLFEKPADAHAITLLCAVAETLHAEMDAVRGQLIHIERTMSVGNDIVRKEAQEIHSLSRTHLKLLEFSACLLLNSIALCVISVRSSLGCWCSMSPWCVCVWCASCASCAWCVHVVLVVLVVLRVCFV